MTRRFNTSGPCDPALHYTVMREALVAKGQVLVDQGRYFTLFAPRQAGKTTYFQLLFRQLQQQGYLPIWISFEGLKTATRSEFYRTLHWFLQRELALRNLHVEQPINNPTDLQMYIAEVSKVAPALVLVIDEFEDQPDVVTNEVLHTFRALYQKREFHKLQSLLLVGVSTIAELVVSSASPFNIVDQLEIPYFTFAEVAGLIGQHVQETGQRFDPAVVKAICENTQGQPGLVSALCQYLVEEVVTDRRQPITLDAFYPTLKYFLTVRQDKNILNIVRKAREKPDFMLRVLFSQTPIPFTIHEPTIAYLAAHGVIQNVNGNVEMPIPLYAKCLITAFRPLINGEVKDYTVGLDPFNEYLAGDGLNLHALIEKYRAYVQRRGFRAFDTEHLKEGAWHYSLDGFIHFFIQRAGGDTLVEVPSGRGRTDILILFKQRKYIIETKVYTDPSYFEQGKVQLADYLTSEGLDEGHYVVFSNRHRASDSLTADEVIHGKHIYTWIIPTAFKAPSRRGQGARRRRKG